jgi:hypothetical protein
MQAYSGTVGSCKITFNKVVPGRTPEDYFATIYNCYSYVLTEINPGPGLVNCCWPSPAQSILVSGTVATDDYVFVLSKTFTCFEMGPPLRREEGSDWYWSLPLYWG